MSDGYDKLRSAFEQAGLPVPPVPQPLRPALRELESWCWATRPIDPMDMYMFSRYAAELLTGPIDDYIAVSHAGHGVNSYAISLHVVHGRVAIFSQGLWGGVYMDEAQQAASLRRQFDGIERILAAATTKHKDGAERLLVLDSPFRARRLCAWVDLTRPPRDATAWLAHQSSGPEPLGMALAALSSPRREADTGETDGTG